MSTADLGRVVVTMLMNVHTKLVAKDRTADFQAIVERLRAEVCHVVCSTGSIHLPSRTRCLANRCETPDKHSVPTDTPLVYCRGLHLLLRIQEELVRSSDLVPGVVLVLDAPLAQVVMAWVHAVQAHHQVLSMPSFQQRHKP